MSRDNLASELCDQVRLKQVCSVTEANTILGILDRHFI